VPASRFLKFKFVSTRQIDAEGLVSSGTWNSLNRGNSRFLP
jgi:hypothetical protein